VDPIADMIVTIKNAYMAKKPETTVPYSKFKMEIAKVLEKEKFIGRVEKADRLISIGMLYENQKPRLSEIKRVSKLGLRIYTKSKKIKLVKGGKGIYIISTPKGVMTSKEARSKNLGGEVICQLW
jgi:small subunit ribosomal protein S8